MAQFDVKVLDELVDALERMGRLDEIAPKMLEEAAPILKEEVVLLAETHKVTGDMASSIKETKPRKKGRARNLCQTNGERPKRHSKYGKSSMDRIWNKRPFRYPVHYLSRTERRSGCKGKDAGSI